MNNGTCRLWCNRNFESEVSDGETNKRTRIHGGWNSSEN
jgi:hypothetical protein